ncbi:N,N-dimethylformamidase beta subunit family domain-containing protein, partial [Actinosynnema sp. NPDC020468]|uniref:N,N-dimethylformamidase beta subunit family domain-containing protein n=1 Tax=Actinosynnema sp. NPDC020468 TaxID=3154488 RepID=UPI0033F5446B
MGAARSRIRAVAAWLSGVVVLAALVVVPTLVAAPVAVAAPCDPPVVNKIACENLQPGADDWQVQSRDDAILGYTTDISSTPGGRVDFKMLTTATSYTIDVFRLGWYGGKGARKIDTVRRTTPQSQPPCLRDGPTALIDCGNWAVSVSWNVPATAVSGIYYARVTRDDNGLQNEIAFVIRDDSSHSKVLFQTSDATWEAYNRYGGNSLYFGDGPG